MLFNSIDFLIFLPIVFFFYWFILKNSLKLQNFWLLAMSYIFYGWWDWRFLFLLLFSTGLDYFSGLKIHNSPNEKGRKFWLILSIGINLGFLGFFKYYNFFIEGFSQMLSQFHLTINPWTLSIILPVGISFYTFHGLSYVFDIYNRRIQPTHNWVNYSLFVSYFPLLIAGPIERADHLLPQIEKPRFFSYASARKGFSLIIWGLFKKIVIADTLAPFVNEIFGNYQHLAGGALILGALYFSIQIYCDFSGYSDIALGVSKLFGIELFVNFKFPYFSRTIPEFWKRWHISLSSWFRDYVYIPLGGSKKSKAVALRNTFIIFIISGFWHGANYTFIFWGLIHAVFFMPFFLLDLGKYKSDSAWSTNKWYPSWLEVIGIIFTFSVVTFAWIFFRAETLGDAVNYIKHINLNFGNQFRSGLIYVAGFLILDFLYSMAALEKYKQNSITLVILTLFILNYWNASGDNFIYFQF